MNPAANTPHVDEIEELREFMLEQDDYLTRSQYGTLLGLLAVAESLQALARALGGRGKWHDE